MFTKHVLGVHIIVFIYICRVNGSEYHTSQTIVHEIIGWTKYIVKYHHILMLLKGDIHSRQSLKELCVIGFNSITLFNLHNHCSKKVNKKLQGIDISTNLTYCFFHLIRRLPLVFRLINLNEQRYNTTTCSC